MTKLNLELILFVTLFEKKKLQFYSRELTADIILCHKKYEDEAEAANENRGIIVADLHKSTKFEVYSPAIGID